MHERPGKQDMPSSFTDRSCYTVQSATKPTKMGGLQWSSMVEGWDGGVERYKDWWSSTVEGWDGARKMGGVRDGG